MYYESQIPTVPERHRGDGTYFAMLAVANRMRAEQKAPETLANFLDAPKAA